jgi:hypothetical protein
MSESNSTGDSNLDHRRLVARHRNVFEPDPATPAHGETLDADSSDNVDRQRRAIISEAGKPCILGAKCRCICQHYHNRKDGASIDTEAHVTASLDRCPKEGHGLND